MLVAQILQDKVFTGMWCDKIIWPTTKWIKTDRRQINELQIFGKQKAHQNGATCKTINSGVNFIQHVNYHTTYEKIDHSFSIYIYFFSPMIVLRFNLMAYRLTQRIKTTAISFYTLRSHFYLGKNKEKQLFCY